MGAAASVSVKQQEIIPLKKLPEMVDDAIYVKEKFPFIVDPTEQSMRFLKYQLGSYYDLKDPTLTKDQLNRALVGAMQWGRNLTLYIENFDKIDESKIFEPKIFPKELLNRNEFCKEEVWKSVLRSKVDDEVSLSPSFVFIICTKCESIPKELQELMEVIRVGDSASSSSDVAAAGDGSSGEQGDGEVEMMEKVAAAFGATENIRNSSKLVEAAFDGELDEMKDWIAKGYHIESTDGRKHSALSEASCQGHMPVVLYLVEAGANPNSRSDSGRTPLWRAAFNGHIEVIEYLLSVGADPDLRDTVSHETAFDVAKTPEIRDLLSNWDRSKTTVLLEKRRKLMLESIEQRIKTAAEREEYAKQRIRQELIEKAESGDWDGIREMLLMIADEADASDSKPRATVEARNETGMSLLAIAAKNNHLLLTEQLLTYWKTIDKDNFTISEGEISKRAKIFKANPNSRDLKGWTCTCIAVFHESGKALQLILENGGDPNIRSSYNKNAWDLAKDELDAAERVVRSRAEIRQILIDHDQTQVSKLFGTGSGMRNINTSDPSKAIYRDLDAQGSAVVMQLEMHASANIGGDSSSAAATSASAGGGKDGGKKGKGKKKTTAKK